MKNIFKAPVSSKDAMQYRTGIAHRYTIATLRWWALITSCAGGRHNMPRPCNLTFVLLTLKVVSESCVTSATSVPILVFLGSLFST